MAPADPIHPKYPEAETDPVDQTHPKFLEEQLGELETLADSRSAALRLEAVATDRADLLHPKFLEAERDRADQPLPRPLEGRLGELEIPEDLPEAWTDV